MIDMVTHFDEPKVVALNDFGVEVGRIEYDDVITWRVESMDTRCQKYQSNNQRTCKQFMGFESEPIRRTFENN